MVVLVVPELTSFKNPVVAIGVVSAQTNKSKAEEVVFAWTNTAPFEVAVNLYQTSGTLMLVPLAPAKGAETVAWAIVPDTAVPSNGNVMALSDRSLAGGGGGMSKVLEVTDCTPAALNSIAAPVNAATLLAAVRPLKVAMLPAGVTVVEPPSVQVPPFAGAAVTSAVPLVLLLY